MTGSRWRRRISAPYGRSVRRTRSASCCRRRRLDLAGAGKATSKWGVPLSRPSGPTTRRRIDACLDGAFCDVWSSPRAFRIALTHSRAGYTVGTSTFDEHRIDGSRHRLHDRQEPGHPSAQGRRAAGKRQAGPDHQDRPSAPDYARGCGMGQFLRRPAGIGRFHERSCATAHAGTGGHAGASLHARHEHLHLRHQRSASRPAAGPLASASAGDPDRALRFVHSAAATAWSIRARCASLAGSSRNEPSIELRARVARSGRPRPSASAIATKLSSR